MAAKSQITRREFLRVSSVAAVAAAIAACQPQTVVVEQTVEVEKEKLVKETVVVEKEKEVTKVVEKEKEVTTVVEKVVTATPVPEAPTLAELVSRGQLPPLEERLPPDPLVDVPAESIGKYGGRWRLLTRPTSDGNHMVRSSAYEPPLRWKPDWSGVQSNLAEAWEASEDGTQFTLHLRKGLKWSDGYPFTSEDIRFWFEDVEMNKELNANPSRFLETGGEPAKFEVLDDLTFRFTYSIPNGTFVYNLCSPDYGLRATLQASHWARTYHADYNPDIADLVEKADVEDWVALYDHLIGDGPQNFTSAGRPRMHGWWIPDGYPAYDGTSTQVEFVRNPYYFKVDPEGNQLPYIDTIVHTLLESRDAMITKVLNGEVDMQWRHIAGPANKSLYYDNMEKGDYHFWTAVSTGTGEVTIHFNLVCQNPVLNEIFNNKDFRIALSYAIDRRSIIDAVMAGAGTPWQPSPRATSLVYNETLATQYTELDLDKAKEHMTAGGFAQDASGKWLGPDGKPISFICEVSASTGYNAQLDMMNLVAQQWQEFGVDMQIKEVERSIFYANKAANLHECMVFAGESGEYFEQLSNPRLFVPISNEAIWGVGWYLWRQSPEDYPQYEPPQVIKELYNIWDNEVKGSADPDVQFEAVKKILDIAQENFWQIGVAIGPDDYGIVKNNFHNVPDMPLAWDYPTFAPANPETFYFDPLS